jgi:hypothetical protein
MRRACREIEAVIDRRAHGLADAERLVLEQHLVDCASCRELSSAMHGVVALLREQPAELASGARERSIAAAFERVAARKPERTVSKRWALGTGGALAAAAVLLALVKSWPSPSTDSLPVVRAPLPPHVSPTELLDSPAAPAAPAPEAWIATTAAEQREFAHAHVQIARGTRVRFHRDSRTLELGEGSLQVDVDARRAESFAVVTEHFRVEVLGTQFTVSPEQVSVQRGRVKVLDRDSKVLLRELTSGSTFTYHADPVAARAKATEGRADVRGSERATESADALLRSARAALAGGDPKRAAALIDQAEQKKLTRSGRAEAATLRAECALLGRDYAAAVRAYLRVAKLYPELSAGENAAFAAAQISAEAGRVDESKSLLERYLAHYPRGRFVAEARARLAR